MTTAASRSIRVWHRPAAKRHGRRSTAEVFRDTPLRGVFVTHIHPDHIGLARWLQQRYDVPVSMSPRTLEQMQAFMTVEPKAAVVDAERFFEIHGVTDRTLLPSLSPTRFVRMTSGLPEVAKTVVDRETVRVGRGRVARSKRTVMQKGTLFARRGKRHAHQWRSSPADDLIEHRLLRGVVAIRIRWARISRRSNDCMRCPRTRCVLPSHGVLFRGLQARIEDLRSHIREQLGCRDASRSRARRPRSRFCRSCSGARCRECIFFLRWSRRSRIMEYLGCRSACAARSRSRRR